MVRLTTIAIGVLVLALLMGLAVPAQAEDARGKVLSVNTEINQLVVQDSTGRNMTFEVEMTCRVFLNNREAQLSDLRSGDTATIRYEPQEDKLMALELHCAR
jgi:hypothetical protein